VPDLRQLSLGGARIVFAMALVAGIGRLAHLPLGSPRLDSALRLALRTPRAQLEVCTERSEEELAKLPIHMRQQRDCVVTAVAYRLRVAIDGGPRLDRELTHHGIRGNRPLVIDELLAVEPGARPVTVDFEPIVPAGREAEAGELPTYHLEGTVDFAAGRISIAALVDDRLIWIPDPGPAGPG